MRTAITATLLLALAAVTMTMTACEPATPPTSGSGAGGSGSGGSGSDVPPPSPAPAPTPDPDPPPPEPKKWTLDAAQFGDDGGSIWIETSNRSQPFAWDAITADNADAVRVSIGGLALAGESRSFTSTAFEPAFEGDYSGAEWNDLRGSVSGRRGAGAHRPEPADRPGRPQPRPRHQRRDRLL